MTSVSYYDEHGEAFFRDSIDVEAGALHVRFLPRLSASARILDAGCGSGRDAGAFARAGFDVTAFDASAEMVRLALAHTGLRVLRMTFDEVFWDSSFDGVWACASLLHVPRRDLPRAMAGLVRALRPGGVLFASFKYGTEEREQHGRFFTDLTEATLADLMHGAGLSVLDLPVTSDVRPGRAHERWVSGVGRRLR